MSHLFRWQYVAPRLMAVIVALLAVQYGLGLSARSRISHSIATFVGAQSELAAARVSYVDGRVTLRGLSIADPRSPARHLLEADCCDLDLDLDTLIRHQTFAGHGQITGLRFFTPRHFLNGQVVEQPPKQMAIAFGEQESRAVSESLQQLNQRFDRDWTQQCPSLQLTGQVAAEWSKSYLKLAQQANVLSGRATDLRTLASVANRNPVRNESFFLSLPADVAAIEHENAALIAHLEKLPDALEKGRRAVIAARAQDEPFVRTCLAAEPLEVSPLADYLFRQQVNQLMSELVGWLRWTRQAVPARSRGLETIPGKNDPIAGHSPKSPRLLLSAVALEGTIDLAGRQIALRGTLTDFTTEPWLLDRPMRLRLTSADPTTLDVQITIDRSGAVARDELLATCRGIKLPALVLGESDGLQILVAPSEVEMNISLQIDGDELTGDSQLVQGEVQLRTALGDKLNLAPLTAPLQETLGGVRSMATRVSFSGTIDEPRCKLWSNLGPAAAAALDIAARRAAEQRTQQLLAQTQQQVDERLARLDRQIAEGQAGMLSRLANSNGDLQSLVAESAPPKRLDVERLGRLPEFSLFR